MDNTKMQKRKFKCTECGFTADYAGSEFNYCPKCATLSRKWQNRCRQLLRLIDMDSNLTDATKLFEKNEYLEAARTATIVLETELKRIGKTDLYGSQLVDELLGFTIDKNTSKLTKKPKIRVNRLRSRVECNEQDGIRLLLAGMFKGLRNVIMHKQLKFSPVHSLSTIVLCNLLFK